MFIGVGDEEIKEEDTDSPEPSVVSPTPFVVFERGSSKGSLGGVSISETDHDDETTAVSTQPKSPREDVAKSSTSPLPSPQSNNHDVVIGTGSTNPFSRGQSDSVSLSFFGRLDRFSG